MATTIYLTNTANVVVGAPDEELLADIGVRGGGLSTGTRDTLTGIASPLTRDTVSDILIDWFTVPLDAVTISGTVTMNFWMAENNMSANVDASVQISRYSAGVLTTIFNTAKGTEIPVTTRAAQNWTGTPASTALAAGDRLRIRMVGGTTGGQASGFTWTGSWAGTSAAADGDSFVTFTETITAQTSRVPRSPGVDSGNAHL